MENEATLPIEKAIAQNNKKAWMSPTVELISSSRIQSGNVSFPIEGRFVLGSSGSTTTLNGDGVGS